MNLKIKYFDEINSTNDYAIDFILNANAEILSEHHAICADKQTAGRGRLNSRTWISVTGNFHCSYIINLKDLNFKESEISSLNSIITNSVCKFLQNLVKSKNINMKLPNDIMINGRKIAGILVETFYPHAVVGIGINLIFSPLERSTNLQKEFNLSFKPKNLIRDLYKTLLNEIAS
jgi:BirA family biotin operon repressor/biotin-[acetyl-CoA-carboxylase] ligase